MEKEILEQKAKMLEEVMNDRSYVPMKAKGAHAFGHSQITER